MESHTTTLVAVNPDGLPTSDKMDTGGAFHLQGEHHDKNDNNGEGIKFVGIATGQYKPNRTANEAHEEKARLPPLPSSGGSVFRPIDCFAFSKLQYHVVARAVGQTAHITGIESAAPTLRIRSGQNIAIASTPKEELAERIQRITVLQLGGKEYRVSAYVAASDMSGNRTTVSSMKHLLQSGTQGRRVPHAAEAPDARTVHAKTDLRTNIANRGAASSASYPAEKQTVADHPKCNGIVETRQIGDRPGSE
ncbi:hypothetical protein HPB50_009469 [Hyalomma asiaticum]|uniref:Uncharacterized protein n=1 Tax=Hyalomma asiaticum TaxID=266040 RepID=A0ACB7SLD6_HYAAI|nr:hypothetical protein HPB50_009469 [Hyalomma asiaticum]